MCRVSIVQAVNRWLALLACACASFSICADVTTGLESAMAKQGKHPIAIPVGSSDQQTILPVTVVTETAGCYW